MARYAQILKFDRLRSCEPINRVRADSRRLNFFDEEIATVAEFNSHLARKLTASFPFDNDIKDLCCCRCRCYRNDVTKNVNFPLFNSYTNVCTVVL
jgi:hypothetical protein